MNTAEHILVWYKPLFVSQRDINADRSDYLTKCLFCGSSMKDIFIYAWRFLGCNDWHKFKKKTCMNIAEQVPLQCKASFVYERLKNFKRLEKWTISLCEVGSEMLLSDIHNGL